MIYAKIDSNKIVLDVIICDVNPDWLDGEWVLCPEWVGVGMDINMPEPAPIVVPDTTVDGAQTF